MILTALKALAVAACAAAPTVRSAMAPPPLAPVVETLHGDQAAVSAILADPSAPESGIAYFEQLIDHENPDLGTFSQTYWYNSTYYEGPGSPIILFTPGEVAATGYTGYLTETAITGLMAKEMGGAIVLIEHRFWGNSTPWVEQTTKNLQYLTLDQAVSDFVHFARTVALPFDTEGAANAPDAPWVWTGGSYSGALGAWIESLQPGTFWATHSSSGPVEAIFDYWQYFTPIQDGMPQNCSRDYTAIIEHVDSVFQHGSPKEIDEMKALFAISDLEHLDDAATAISGPIWAWQSIQMTSGYGSFYQMCDAIELGSAAPNVSSLSSSSLSSPFPRTAKVPGEEGVGLDKALPNFAAWFKKSYLPGYCASYGYDEWQDPSSVECWNTYNETSPMYTDWTEANGFWRTWVWMTCNEPFFYYQTGAPPSHPTVFSRLVGPDYYQRQCPLFFPAEGNYTYGSAKGATAKKLNARTEGWFLDDTSRLYWANGEFDPWRSSSVASVYRPGGPIESTEEAPSVIIKGSRHCNEMRTSNYVNEDIKAAGMGIVAQIKEWVGEFGKAAGKGRKRGDLW